MATGQLVPAAFPRPAFRLAGVPVLLYHGLCRSTEKQVSEVGSKYWISLPQFHEQVKQILRGGRRIARLSDLWGGATDSAEAGSAVIVTFDDGQSSDYAVAFPVLQDAGARADFFVNTAAVGERGYLSWAQIAEMQRAGMAFHSHSHDHVALPRLDVRQLERQLKDSKQLLEDHLGRPAEFLAAPYGLLNRRVVDAARQAGYRAVCSSRPWPARPGAALVNRVAIYPHTTAGELEKLLAGDPLWYAKRAAGNAFLYLPKQVLLRYRPSQLGVRVLENQA